MADRVVDRGEAIQVQEDDAGPGGHRGVAQHVPGALLDIGPVWQAGQAVVEGEVGDLLAQRDLVAHVARGDQHLDGLAGHLVAQQGRLDVPPRPVGGPDPDREPAGALESLEALASFGVAAEGQPDRGQHGGPVLGMDEVEQPPAGQRRGRVAVVLDRRARVPDHAVQVADQDDVAGPVGQVAQAPAGLPPDAEHGQVLPHQHEDPRGQHEHPGAARHDQRDPGRRRAGQAVGYHHHGGHGGGQHRDDGRRRRTRRAAGPTGPEPFGHPPRRRAEQQRRDHREQLARDAQVSAQHPLTHGQRVADGDGEQGQVGQRDPPPGGGDHGQQRAEHGQVGQRVDEREQERARPFAGPVELGAEQRGPADHQQGDGHHVAIGEPGQHRAGRTLLRAAADFPFGHGEHGDADGHGGQGQQRRQVGEGQAGGGVQRAAEDPLHDQAGAVQRGTGREPPVGPRDGTLVPAGAEPQAHRRPEPRQHAKHGHARRSDMISRTRAPSVPPAVLNYSTHAGQKRIA